MAKKVKCKYETMPVYGKKAKLRNSIRKALRKNNGYRANGCQVASYATMRERRGIIYQGLFELYDAGYQITDVGGFGLRHMQYLVADWVVSKKAPGTIQNRFSTFKAFCEWIGKKGMIMTLDKYIHDPTLYKRKIASNRDKSWTAQGVDPREKIDEVFEIDPRVGYQLELQWAFGLRAQEGWMLHPNTNNCDHYLEIIFGPKTGKNRIVPIETEAQRRLLREVVSYANSGPGSLMPLEKKRSQWKNHFYAVLRQCGITQEGEGITSHGLRHEYANYRYQVITGSESWIRAVALGHAISKVDPILDKLARQEISKDLGHGREQIAGAYVGSKR